MHTNQNEVRPYPLWIQLLIGIYMFRSVIFVVTGLIYHLKTGGLLWSLPADYYWIAAPGVAIVFIVGGVGE